VERLVWFLDSKPISTSHQQIEKVKLLQNIEISAATTKYS